MVIIDSVITTMNSLIINLSIKTGSSLIPTDLQMRKEVMRFLLNRVKAEFPNILGNLDLEVVLDWFYEVDKLFDIMDILE
ncbi:hypothetical protein Tco_0294154 [Tanacetum coccineum]